MGRIADLLGAVAAAAEEGPEGLQLAPEDRATLLEGWSEDDVDDALGLVRDSLLLSELVEAADAVAERLRDSFAALDDDAAFEEAQRGGHPLKLDTVSHFTRELDRLEEVLELFRDEPPRDRTRLDALRRRLMDLGIEEEMDAGREGDGGSGRRGNGS